MVRAEEKEEESCYENVDNTWPTLAGSLPSNNQAIEMTTLAISGKTIVMVLSGTI
jgi:hypothetical protein